MGRLRLLAVTRWLGVEPIFRVELDCVFLAPAVWLVDGALAVVPDFEGDFGGFVGELS